MRVWLTFAIVSSFSLPLLAQERANTGNIAGVVRFKGVVKTPRVIPVRRRGDWPTEPVFDNSLLIDPKSRGIFHVAVYLEKAPAGVTIGPQPTKPVEIEFEGARLWPRVAFARTNQPVRVTNREAIGFRFSAKCPVRNEGFTRYIEGLDSAETPRSFSVRFDRREPFPFQMGSSQYESWLTSYLLVLDHPFAAVSDGYGRFRIDGLPPGRHAFRVWHERTGLRKEPLVVEVEAGKTSKVQFAYTAKDFEPVKR